MAYGNGAGSATTEERLRILLIGLRNSPKRLFGHEALPSKNIRISWKVVYFGDAAHIFIYHQDIEEPIARAICAWGDRKTQRAALQYSFFRKYLRNIMSDPDGLGYSANPARVNARRSFSLCHGLPSPKDE